MTTEITIQRMTVRVPRDGIVRSVRDGEALAAAISSRLAQSLTGQKQLRCGTIDRMHVTAPRGSNTTDGAAKVASAAIRGQMISRKRS
jgi:hypothetical protein